MSARQQIPDVLLVLPVLEPAGAERVVAELARRLPDHGFETSVLCLEDENAPVGRELKDAGVRVDGLNTSRRLTFACAKGIASRVQEMNPAAPMIVNAHLYHANIAARQMVPRLPDELKRKVRVVTTVHVAERRFRPWQFWLDRMTARYGAREICIAKSVAEFHRRKTGLPQSFFSVIENGIDLDRFETIKRNEQPGSKVVSVGRLNKQKDFPTLLRAWQIVEAKNPHATLEIAGSGPEEESLRRLQKTLGLNRAAFVGFQNDIPGFLAVADLYVQSSAWEGMPLTILEAMVAGLPVIASAVDSIPEIIENGCSGILFERGNYQRLADQILAVLNNAARARLLGNSAREIATKRFSADRMVAAYAALFREVLEKPEAPL